MSVNGGNKRKVKSLKQGSPLNRNKAHSLDEKTNSIESDLKEKRNKSPKGAKKHSKLFFDK